MGTKWTKEHRENFMKGMEERAKLKRLNGDKPKLNGSHQGIIYLKAAERTIKGKMLSELTEAEVYAHLAYKAFTEKA